jgi:DNA-binding beta-propeller fold protein YncE
MRLRDVGNAAACKLGSDDFQYDVDVAWARVPDGWRLGDVAAVGLDANDKVYVFNRGEHPMMVFDREGRFASSWGEGVFTRPHGLHIAPDGFAYCTDDGDHTVRKCTLDGTVVLTIGVPDQPTDFMSGLPFNRCTHTALSPSGDIYISDGYGNARIHQFSPRGDLIRSWGGPGSGPGEFYVPHNICCDRDGWVYVADRENHRIQVFNGEGAYEMQWNNLHRPCALFLTAGADPRMYVGELGPMFRSASPWPPNLGAGVRILDGSGRLLARLGAPTMGTAPTQFVCPHGIVADSLGDIYVGETANIAWPSVFDDPPPADLVTLRKLVRRPPDNV